MTQIPEKKQLIKDSARVLILKHSYEQFRLDDLLNDLNISKGGFYHYFKSVNQLLLELITEDFEQDILLIKQFNRDNSPKEALIQIFQSLSSKYQSDLGILSSLHSHKNLTLYLQLMEQAWYQPFKLELSSLINKGKQDGSFPPINTLVICELFEAINKHANQCELLSLWDDETASQYTQTALLFLAQELNMQQEIKELLS